MPNCQIHDIPNNQSAELKFPMIINSKFESGTPLDAPPIKFQIAFRNEFDD